MYICPGTYFVSHSLGRGGNCSRLDDVDRVVSSCPAVLNGLTLHFKLLLTRSLEVRLDSCLALLTLYILEAAPGALEIGKGSSKAHAS